MMQSIFDKTDKGRDEIATRRYNLPPRMRTLLLLFDGKQSAEDVLSKINGLGLSQQHIKELVEGGFIAGKTTQAVAQPQPKVPAPVQPASQDTEAHLQALYAFYSDTIRSAIGLRGYALQLKVERARSVEDFRAMRPDYLAAVRKAQGDAHAEELDRQLLRILGTP